MHNNGDGHNEDQVTKMEIQPKLYIGFDLRPNMFPKTCKLDVSDLTTDEAKTLINSASQSPIVLWDKEGLLKRHLYILREKTGIDLLLPPFSPDIPLLNVGDVLLLHTAGPDDIYSIRLFMVTTIFHIDNIETIDPNFLENDA